MNHKISENGGMGAQTIMLTDQALHNHNLSNDPLLSQQLANEVRLRNFAVAAAAAATGIGATGNWSAPNMGGTNSGAGGGGERQALLQFPDFFAQMSAQFGIQIGKRLIQQQDLGFENQGAGNGNALLLATG